MRAWRGFAQVISVEVGGLAVSPSDLPRGFLFSGVALAFGRSFFEAVNRYWHDAPRRQVAVNLCKIGQQSSTLWHATNAVNTRARPVARRGALSRLQR